MDGWSLRTGSLPGRHRVVSSGDPEPGMTNPLVGHVLYPQDHMLLGHMIY